MNIKMIAQMAGVSVATVSKIINNYSDVGEETRQRVLKIMDETGYKPSSSAKTLATKKSNLIGVVFAGELNSDLNHPFFVKVINSFKKQIGVFGYDLLLFSNENFFSEKEDYLARCRHFQVDGCIIIAGDQVEPSVHQLDQSDIPCIGVDIKLSGKNSAYIMSDNEKISAKVVEHLYLNGYRKIGFLGIERHSEITSLRENAFRETLKTFGLAVNPDWFVYSSDYEEENGYRAVKQLIEKGALPEAMFAVSDLLAFGAIRAMKEHGLRIPGDMALIGCDDIDACRYTDPALSTVKQDTEKIGRLAAMMLYDMVNKQMDPSAIVVEAELVARQSCGKTLP
ncbi:LacI family DNA-binding transcriptional regulator [Cohnella sp. CFH 77786]|uniref:LacI family DNA-binding transcriptional regulator n=1 Tax=Cohnella sp. CFH 77786 TaxID=2662265 RepID=UPI001C61030E|nr:LacI family DNA-binding transcriptional regulator [Cohnella sp. CFH 77786]MBW5447049.1 LacI family DNA-binding transcriptional regulator [Cohnella sp. CFH 77786]